ETEATAARGLEQGPRGALYTTMGSRKIFTTQELAQLADRTLEHYRENAEDFREGTRDHDVSQNIATLLKHVVAPPPFTILDFGCGPGRDLATFTQFGHRAIGLDNAAQVVAMARSATGGEVWQQDFLHRDLPDSTFGGILRDAAP